MAMSVADAVTVEGNWNWNLVYRLLPHNLACLIAGMDPPRRDDREDEMIWGPDPRGKFTVKSAYEILDVTEDDPDSQIWKTIWQWNGPSRIKHFLWTLAHGRILTNAERMRRHLSTNADCANCPGIKEDALHVVRDCGLAKQVWQYFIQPVDATSFFSDSLHAWMLRSLKHPDFSLTFGIVIWLLWKARNEAIFENKPVTSDQLRLRVLHWITGVRETMRADSQVSLRGANRRIEALIGWNLAPPDWVTLNTDGSVLSNNRAAAGGIIRDHVGRTIATFSANLGTCTIMRAELRAAEMGFKVAWDLGLRKVHLQVDSLAAAAAINGEITENPRHEGTLLNIRELRHRNWETVVSHTFREGNVVADLLAHHGHLLNFGIHTDCNYPAEVRSAIWDDFCRIVFPRLIHSNN
ncbi:Putative ribonuclease H protein At1g65750 [Linum perenne]